MLSVTSSAAEPASLCDLEQKVQALSLERALLARERAYDEATSEPCSLPNELTALAYDVLADDTSNANPAR